VSTEPKKKRRWSVWLAVAVFALAVVLVDRVLGKYQWKEVAAHLYATSPRALLEAAVLTVCSYLMLTFYDLLGVRNAGARLRWRTVATASFTAYAVAHNVGFSALAGGSVRYRIYSNAGLTGMQIAQVIAFCTLTFALGSILLGGLSMIMQPVQAGWVMHVSPNLARVVGSAMMLVVIVYVATGTIRRKPIMLRGAPVQLPGVGMSLLQVGAACVDLCLASGVLYVLMPEGSTGSFIGFLGIYLLAAAAGLVSSVPGGLGVFETVLLLLTPSGAADAKLAAVLAYRVIYYVAPFLVALFVMAGHEVWLQRTLLARWIAWGRAWLRVVTPHVVSAAVFAGGVVLLFSGATPMMDERMHLLRHIVPLPLLEASHLLGSAVGMALLLLAQSVQRRLDAAWHVTLVLLIVGAVASLVKGFDYEEALVLTVMAAMLVAARDRFHRKASLLDQRFSPIWVLAAVAALFAGIAGAWMLLRPSPHDPELPGEEDLERARLAIAESTDTAANIALLGDKNLLFSADGRGFVMFRPVGRSWIAMGDPVGPPAIRAQLVWQFREACDRYAARSVFYQIGVDDLPNYLDAGLTLSKIGEEARVDLTQFGLEGSRWAELRQIHRRAQRDGASSAVLSTQQVVERMPALRAISDQWLVAKSVAEKGFSLGRFDERYLSRFPCAVVKVGDRIVAFANIWASGDRQELSVDLMRYDDHAPKGVMDYLLIELMLWGKQQGYAWFNLGMAPLSGLVDREFSPMWNRVGAFVYRHGEHFYNFEGLRDYKEKFHPEWRPRYLATPGRSTLPRVIMDLTTLIAGSSRRIVMR
jgi:phosphatidylglycerol lysyltransferase